MTRPCSIDLRERVVDAHLAGEPIRSVAARYRKPEDGSPNLFRRLSATETACRDTLPHGAVITCGPSMATGSPKFLGYSRSRRQSGCLASILETPRALAK